MIILPNLRQRLNQFIDRRLNRPEYYRFMLENVSGYRSRREALAEYNLIRNEESATLYNDVIEARFEYALKVYGRAGRPNLEFLVLGRKEDRLYHSRISTERYPFIDNRMRINLGRLNEINVPFGSAMDSSNWTFYMNDMMIYGGIANRRYFYLASKREMDVLWDPNQPQASIFARELAGLFAAGYELRRLPDGSEVMVPPRGTIDFSLSNYMKTLPYYMTRESILSMTQPNLRGMLFVRGRNQIIPYERPLYSDFIFE